MKSSLQWLIERFSSEPDRIAFVHEGRTVDYGRVVKKIGEYEALLLDSGVKSGEIVVVLGDYSPEVFCMILALAHNGNVIVPMSRNSVVELDVALDISGSHWVAEFDHDRLHPTLKERVSVVRSQLLTDFRLSGQPALVLFSSGSTGRPKGILHDFNRVCEKFRKQRSPLVAIPFLMIDHFGGINTILAIVSGLGTVVTVSDRSAAEICRAIERYKVELLPATPSFLTMLLASGVYRSFDLSSLKRITYGTEVMPPSTLQRLKSIFPDVVLQQTYGLSEVGVLHSKSRDDGSLWMRIGGEGFQTKVINGGLWIKSEYAMVGYLNAPSDFDDDGWFNTQDQVETDGEYFRILGRVTDIINVGGQKVYPAEVEDIILALDNITDVAVFGEAHRLLGQIVVAKVMLDQPEPLVELKNRIRMACLEKLSPFKVPAKVVVTEEPFYTFRQKKARRA